MIRIESSYFVAGVELCEGVVVNAAPIVGYMVGWRAHKVMDYCKRKGWKWLKLKSTLGA